MIKNIVLAGGANKGIAYLGVYKYFLEQNLLKDIELFSGTSIGSLFCLFMILNYTYQEIEKIIYNIDNKCLEDVNIKYFFTNYGFDTGIKVEHFIKQIIISKGLKYDITFKELYELTKKRLDICTTKLNDYSQFIFNHINTPDAKVYKACKYSTNIPLIWCSSVTEEGIHYIDGCFSTNLPIEHIPIKDTLGIYCLAETSKEVSVEKISDIKEFIIKVIGCSFSRGNELEIKNYLQLGYKILCIKIPKINSLDFGLNIETKKILIDRGYEVIANKFKK